MGVPAGVKALKTLERENRALPQLLRTSLATVEEPTPDTRPGVPHFSMQTFAPANAVYGRYHGMESSSARTRSTDDHLESTLSRDGSPSLTPVKIGSLDASAASPHARAFSPMAYDSILNARRRESASSAGQDVSAVPRPLMVERIARAKSAHVPGMCSLRRAGHSSNPLSISTLPSWVSTLLMVLVLAAGLSGPPLR